MCDVFAHDSDLWIGPLVDTWDDQPCQKEHCEIGSLDYCKRSCMNAKNCTAILFDEISWLSWMFRKIPNCCLQLCPAPMPTPLPTNGLDGWAEYRLEELEFGEARTRKPFWDKALYITFGLGSWVNEQGCK